MAKKKSSSVKESGTVGNKTYTQNVKNPSFDSGSGYQKKVLSLGAYGQQAIPTKNLPPGTIDAFYSQQDQGMKGQGKPTVKLTAKKDGKAISVKTIDLPQTSTTAVRRQIQRRRRAEEEERRPKATSQAVNMSIGGAPLPPFSTQGTVTAVIPKGPSDYLRGKLVEARESTKSPAGFSARRFGAAVGLRVFDFGQLAYGAVFKPKETYEKVGAGFFSVLKNPASEVRRVVSEARLRPDVSGGKLTGDIILSKGLAKAPGVVGRVATRIDPRYRGVSTLPTGEQVIKNVPGLGDIGLIPERSGKASQGPATIRGAFGYSQSEQKAFLGTVGATTSQRGLTRGALNFIRYSVRKKPVPILNLEGDFGIFATPSDLTTGRLQSRISRLGKSNRATFADIFSGDVTFKPAPKPEVIVFPKEVVGRKGGFETLGYGSSELETATLAPRLGGAKEFKLRGTKGVTSIGGKRVLIKEAAIFEDAGLSFADDFKPRGKPGSQKPSPSLKTGTSSNLSPTKSYISIPKTSLIGGAVVFSSLYGSSKSSSQNVAPSSIFSGGGSGKGSGTAATRGGGSSGSPAYVPPTSPPPYTGTPDRPGRGTPYRPPPPSYIGYPKIPGTPPPTYKQPKRRKAKRRREEETMSLDFRTLYRPDLTAVSGNIFGSVPKDLTGLEVRKQRRKRR